MKSKIFAFLFLLALSSLALADQADDMFSVDNQMSAASATTSKKATTTRIPYGVKQVHFNSGAMLKMAPKDETNLILPDGRQYSIVFDRSESHKNGDTSWIGHLKGMSNSYRAIITTGADGSFGRVVTPSGEVLIKAENGSTYLVDPHAVGLKPALPESEQELDMALPAESFNYPKNPNLNLFQGGTGTSTSPTLGVTASGSTTTPLTNIDLMVVYTPGFVSSLGSVSNAQTRINNLLAIANQAYVDSGVFIHLRLVYTGQVNYSETTSQSTALSDITFGTGAGLSGIAALRNQYGADLVMMMRHYSYTNFGGLAGLAWIGGAGNTAVSNYANYAYSVVADGYDSGYYVYDTTFTHEMGHNMGCVHDRRTVGTNASNVAYQGAYPWSFGYGIDNGFVSIMGYPTYYTNSLPIARFSNPLQSDCDGVLCGVADAASNSADNSSTLNNTRVDVSNFRAATVPLGLAPTTTSITPSANPAVGSVILTAGVSGGIVTGTVTFMDGATNIGTAGVLNGNASIRANLAIGVHSIVATYSGNSTYAPSSSVALSETIATCNGTLGTSTMNVGTGGQTSSISYTVPLGCNWITQTDSYWATVTSGNSGNGNGIITVQVAPNTGAARTAHITISGVTLTITQAGTATGGACTYSLSTYNLNPTKNGSTTVVNVTTGASCNWIVTRDSVWNTVILGGLGQKGSGSFTVLAGINATGVVRIGHIVVGNNIGTPSQVVAPTLTITEGK